MDDLEIQLDLCHYWVDIYIVLENYDKAYDSLCIQVDKEHCLSKDKAILISQKSHLSSRLRSKLETKKYQSTLCKEILDEMNRLRIGL